MLFICLGCERAGGLKPAVPNESMIGTWKWIYTRVGMAGRFEEVTAGHEYLLKLDRDSTFSVMVNGRSRVDGKYSVVDNRYTGAEIRLHKYPGPEATGWGEIQAEEQPWGRNRGSIGYVQDDSMMVQLLIDGSTWVFARVW